MIELIVKAKHFEDTRFLSICNCALAKAAKDQFNSQNVSEGMDSIDINKITYSHKEYDEDDFFYDRKKAASLNYSDEVIRTIQLTPIN